MRRYLPFIIIAAVLLVALVTGALLFRSAQPPAAQQIPTTLTATAPGPPGAQPPHIKGAQNAPVVLEEFGDFQCPPCAALHPELKKIEAAYGAQVSIVFRHFPLTKLHKNALAAARASEAAARQNRFWEMHNQLYVNQAKWSDAPDVRPIFIGYARDLGLDTERFTRDMNDNETVARILADLRRGESLGVTGTPTVFLNNRELPYETLKSDVTLRAAIDAALNGKAQ